MERGALSGIFFVSQRKARRSTEVEIAFTREVPIERRQRCNDIVRKPADDLATRSKSKCQSALPIGTVSGRWREIMLVAGFDGVITAVNAAWTATFSWSEAALPSRHFIDLVHPEGLSRPAKPPALAVKTLRSGIDLGTVVGMAALMTSHGPPYPEDELILPSGRSITAEQDKTKASSRVEGALRQPQKMEAVGQLHRWSCLRLQRSADRHWAFLELLHLRVARGGSGRSRASHQSGAERRAPRRPHLTPRLLAFSRRPTLESQTTRRQSADRRLEETLRRTVSATVDFEIVGAVGCGDR